MYLPWKIELHAETQTHSCPSSQEQWESRCQKWKGESCELAQPRWTAHIHSGQFASLVFYMSGCFSSFTQLNLSPIHHSQQYFHTVHHPAEEPFTHHTAHKLEGWASPEGGVRMLKEPRVIKSSRCDGEGTERSFHFGTFRFKERIVLSSWDYIAVSMSKRYHGSIPSNHLSRTGYSIILSNARERCWSLGIWKCLFVISHSHQIREPGFCDWWVWFPSSKFSVRGRWIQIGLILG